MNIILARLRRKIYVPVIIDPHLLVMQGHNSLLYLQPAKQTGSQAFHHLYYHIDNYSTLQYDIFNPYHQIIITPLGLCCRHRDSRRGMRLTKENKQRGPDTCLIARWSLVENNMYTVPKTRQISESIGEKGPWRGISQ
jgi:hypothetical protein